MAANVSTVTVIGAGTMGSGIAHVAALAGFATLLYDPDSSAADRAIETIAQNLARGVEKGKVAAEDAGTAIQRIEPVQSLEEAGKRADFIIEAAPENMAVKVDLFLQLERVAQAHVVLASNTSGLSITEMAAATRRPARVVGMHFFNPVHMMKLCEIVRGLETDAETIATTVEVARRMGKETVTINESPGFVTSRVNAVIGNEAFAMLETGVATAEDIDKALKLGLNHPMGPFELVDLVGLDVRLAVLKNLQATLGDKYRPSPLLEKYVKAGRLGRKVGRGVYTYTEQGREK